MLYMDEITKQNWNSHVNKTIQSPQNGIKRLSETFNYTPYILKTYYFSHIPYTWEPSASINNLFSETFYNSWKFITNNVCKLFQTLVWSEKYGIYEKFVRFLLISIQLKQSNLLPLFHLCHLSPQISTLWFLHSHAWNRKWIPYSEGSVPFFSKKSHCSEWGCSHIWGM